MLTALTEAATGVQEAIDEPYWDADVATLLASIAVYRDGALSRLSRALGSDAPALPQAAADLPRQLGPDSAPLCRTLDGLGYALEVQAARRGGARDDGAATQAQSHRALAEQVAVLAGYDGTDSDPRQVSYAVDDDLDETIARWQAELVPAWLATIGPAAPEDRALLLSQTRAAAGVAPPPAEDAFPGLQASSAG